MYLKSKYRSYCTMNSRQQQIQRVFLLRELAFVIFSLLHELTFVIFLRLICIQKSTMTCLLINNYDSTTELSTIICDTMWRRHSTMSSVDLLHELDVFTTRVKTKTVPAMGYSTSIILVQHKSLRLIFCFLLYHVLKFLTARTRSKI